MMAALGNWRLIAGLGLAALVALASGWALLERGQRILCTKLHFAFVVPGREVLFSLVLHGGFVVYADNARIDRGGKNCQRGDAGAAAQFDNFEGIPGMLMSPHRFAHQSAHFRSQGANQFQQVVIFANDTRKQRIEMVLFIHVEV